MGAPTAQRPKKRRTRPVAQLTSRSTPALANTKYLKTVVEQYVRHVMTERHGQAFTAVFLPLRPGGKHEFDAVSRDRSIVVSVNSASGLTSDGRVPSGKIKDCLAELYFLSLVEAPTRILVLTTPAFHDIFAKMTVGKIVEGVVVECVPLPPEMQEEVDLVVGLASAEVSPVANLKAVAAELESGDI